MMVFLAPIHHSLKENLPVTFKPLNGACMISILSNSPHMLQNIVNALFPHVVMMVLLGLQMFISN